MYLLPTLLFFLLNTGAATVAFLAAARFQGGRSGARFGLTFMVNWLLFTHSVILACGLIGHLNPYSVLIVTWAAAVAAIWRWKACVGSLAFVEPVADQQDWPPMVRATVMGCMVAAAAFWVYQLLVLPVPSTTWDDQAYHAACPTEWLRAGRIELGRIWSLKAYFPQSAGVITTWFRLPWGASIAENMTWIHFSGMAAAITYCLAVKALFDSLGARRSAWMLAAGFLFMSPLYMFAGRTHSAVNLAMGVAIFSAVVFIVPIKGASQRSSDVVYAALLCGLALGMKPTASIVMVFLALVTLIQAWQTTGWRKIPGIVGVWILATLLTGGYWYLRNAFVTGNPLYPASILGLPGVTTFPRTRLAEFADMHGIRTTAIEILISYFDLPYLLGAVFLLGVLATFWGVWRYRFTPGDRWFQWWALAAGLCCTSLATLYNQPFSAGWYFHLDSGHLEEWLVRYIALMVLIGWVSFTLVLERSGHMLSAGSIAGGTAVAAGYFFCKSATMRIEFAIIAVFVGTASVLIGRAGWKPVAFRPQLKWVVAASLAVTLCVFLLHPAKTRKTYQNQIEGALEALEEEPPGRGVWSFARTGNHRLLDLFGGKHQHQVIAVDQNGKAMDGPAWEGDLLGEPLALPTVSASEFIENLRQAGVTHLVIRMYEDLPEPEQGKLLKESGQAECLATDQYISLWRINPRSPRESRSVD